MLIETKCPNCGMVVQHDDSAVFRFCPYCGIKAENPSGSHSKTKAFSKRDYYEILGLNKGASDDEIKKSFRAQAKTCHPDLHPGDEAAKVRFKELNEAYNILSDPDKKSRYDRFGHNGINSDELYGQNPFDGAFDIELEALFPTFFGIGHSAPEKRKPQKGNDLKCYIQMNPSEAMSGTTKTIRIKKEEDCKACDGSGKIPATCPKCNGVGKITEKTQTLFGETSVLKICPTCNYRGHVGMNPCVKCSGQGRLLIDKDLPVVIPPRIRHGSRLIVKGEGQTGKYGGNSGDLLIEIVVI